MLDSYERPAIVKIDVEQGELALLKGATRLLRDVRPVTALYVVAGFLHPDHLVEVEVEAYKP